MNVKRKIWGPREEYRPLLEQTIKLFPTMLKHIRPERIFLCGFIARRSKHVAKIHASRTPWNLLLPNYDYAIEFWDPRFRSMPESHKIYIVFHELHHICDGGFIVKGPDYRKLKGHDVEDFSWMLTMYGVHMENADKILKGEEYIFVKRHKSVKIHRFPRLPVNMAK